MSGFIKVYGCLCSESADHESWIPDRCAGHDRPVTGSAENVLAGGMTASHECGERLCSGGIRQLDTAPRRRTP